MPEIPGPLKRIALPLIVAIPAASATWDAVLRASWASLGRDQGIFQYIAWAVAHGEIAYRDVRDVNGPVIMMVHALFQRLGGGDEHRFRVLDLVCTVASYAIAGALLPRWKTEPTTRIAWAFASVVVLLAQYLVYGFWDTAQRESFLDWFMLVSIALLAIPRVTPAILVASGALSLLPCLGKPTFALFTAAQLVALAIEREPLRERFRRIALFGGGGAIGLVPPLVYLFAWGDARAWASITFREVPTMYRFIWPRPAGAILSMPGYATIAQLAFATTLGLLVLVALGRLSRRALPIALLPVLGIISVVVQAKGFPYHFHPVTLGISYAWLVALAATWERVVDERARFGLAAVLTAGLLLGGRALFLARAAPFPPAPRADARDKASLESAVRLSAFDRIDFFPRALRDGAEYVAAHTKPTDRVQMYGMDAYFLFLAERKSATPYVYAYDLNVDAALHGSFDPGGPQPTESEATLIRDLQSTHERDLLARLESAPPAAFVFVDRSPLMNGQDAVLDFSEHCATAALWLQAHYRETANFEGIRVWLRDDLAAVAEERQ